MDNSSDFIKKYEEFESKKLEPKVLATEVTRSGLDVCLVSFVKMAKHARGTKRRKGSGSPDTQSGSPEQGTQLYNYYSS
jgi:hypothetical protein